MPGSTNTITSGLNLMSSEMMRNERLERPLARRVVALLFVRQSPPAQDSRHDSRTRPKLPIMQPTESAPDVADRTLAIRNQN